MISLNFKLLMIFLVLRCCTSQESTTEPLEYPSTTTTSEDMIPDLFATMIERTYVCKGEEKVIQPIDMDHFLLVSVESFYGVTNDHTCQFINPQNCKQKFNLVCEEAYSCTVSLFDNITLTNCDNQTADYIEFRYRNVFTRKRNLDPSDICSPNSREYENGIIATKNPDRNCSQKISFTSNYIFRIYVSFLDMDPPIDGECKSSYLELKSKCDSVRYCGPRMLNTSYVYQSCSNYFDVTFVTPNKSNDFSIYFEHPMLELHQAVCPSNWAFLDCFPTLSALTKAYITKAFYGTGNHSECNYKKNDCIQGSIFESSQQQASWFEPLNEVIGNKDIMLGNCENKYATYTYFAYKCIPGESGVIDEYNICDPTLKDITASEGFIKSYSTVVNNECKQTIVAPINKKINMWFIKLKLNDESDCLEEYVRINDSLGTYSYCGKKSFSLENKLCSSVSSVSYKTLNKSASDDDDYGFKLYYNFVDRDPDDDCNKSGIPSTAASASDEKVSILCRGDEKRIGAPNGYSIFPIELVYGVTENGSCSFINPQNCIVPANFTCPTQGNCTLSLKKDIQLAECGNRNADYIKFRYRIIPITSNMNQSICSVSLINGDEFNYGVITSPNYPNWEPNINCQTKIFSLTGKIIRIFLTDLSIDQPDSSDKCNNGYLKLTSDCETVYYCGNKTLNGSYIFSSCSNTLTISYVSNTSSLNLRGFNLYYDVINEETSSNIYTVFVCSTNAPTFTNICFGSYTTQFWPVVISGLYGVHNQTTDHTCKYSNGDCYMDADVSCNIGDKGVCSYVPDFSVIKLKDCEYRKPNYLKVNYRCLPASSTLLPNYNVCDKTLNDITTPRGIIFSPNNELESTRTECVQKIVAPKNKKINIWFPYFFFRECNFDYLMISDGTNNYSLCGYNTTSFENKICASEIKISYVSLSIPGDFIMYYEFVDLVQNECNSSSTITTQIMLNTTSNFTTSTVTSKSTTTSTSFHTTPTATTTTDTITTVTKTKPTSRYVTIITKPENSKHLIAWFFGIGVPLVVIIAILTFFIYRRGKKTSNENFEFSKIK